MAKKAAKKGKAKSKASKASKKSPKMPSLDFDWRIMAGAGALIVVGIVLLVIALVGPAADMPQTPADADDQQEQDLDPGLLGPRPDDIADLALNIESRIGEELSVDAYLQHVPIERGLNGLIHEYYITDGEGQVELTGLSDAQKALFPEDGISEDVYTVEGMISRSTLGGVRFDVESIN